MTVWSVFDATSDYFPVSQAAMFNYRVENLDRLMEQLKSEGVKVDEKRQDEPWGKFGWCYDPDGNKIELWEPKSKEERAADSSKEVVAETTTTVEPDSKKAKIAEQQK